MIELKVSAGQRILELGCGANPHPQTHVRVDVRGVEGVTDFVADFEQLLPIADADFDGLYCGYALEHVSYPKTPQFLSECFRILKPGAKAVFTVPNTEAQLRWIWEHSDGWDGEDSFVACSKVLYGSQDYSDNQHKAYFSPGIASRLFFDAGFEQVKVYPYGERNTDLCVEAVKPPKVLGTLAGFPVVESDRISTFGNPIFGNFTHGAMGEISKTQARELFGMELLRDQPAPSSRDGGAGSVEEERRDAPSLTTPPDPAPLPTAADLYDRHYFGGGGKVGGYAREGYWDFPVHEVTARHVLARRPESVLELGCARGYIGKRIQDVGIGWAGVEVGRHCFLTRVADPVHNHDLCGSDWGSLFANANPCFDLCFSIATLEHIPEDKLPAVIREMVRTCKRGLHGVDFGVKDDGFDKTHCTLKPREWWLGQFNKHAPGWPVEILDKEELERGSLPPEVLAGDGKIKLNLGSFTTMFHHGWVNLDNHPLQPFAEQHNYRFGQLDLRHGLPFPTGSVDLLFASHLLDQFAYAEGLSLLRECRRVIKPDGVLRIVNSDAEKLITAYYHGDSYDYHEIGDKTARCKLKEYAEINGEVADSPTNLCKLWALLMGGKAASYDCKTLGMLLTEAGWASYHAAFRASLDYSGSQQILRETLDLLPCLSFYTDARPLIG